MLIMMNCKHLSIILVIILSQNLSPVLGDEEISNYIRKCCISGLRHARTAAVCEKYEAEISSIPPLWLGLCHSTFGVCCSREVDKQKCELGRLAALEGTRCDKNDSSTSYADCCRACLIGLAVKTSHQSCKDPLFSYFSEIESYRACCYEKSYGNSEEKDVKKESDVLMHEDNIDDLDNADNTDNDEDDEKENTSDGTIVLHDDDDICNKIPNLCAHICENTFDAYQCRCRPGFKLDDNNVTCTEIPDYIQSNNDGSDGDDDDDDEEKCRPGYEIDPTQGKCVDIDECSANLYDCEPGQFCHNTHGGYHCLNKKAKSCEKGYRFDIKTEACEDYNECDESPCDVDYSCFNYPGGYECKRKSGPPISNSNQKCGTGFELKDDRCVDINECLGDEVLCEPNQMCINTLGSYHCDCKIGFSLDATTNVCIDINECSINNHNCLPTQRCDNTIGSYICTRLQSCGTGYTLNAETGNCDDDDECALNTHNCLLDYECHNTKGSFRCYKKTTTTTTTTSTTTTTTTTPVPPSTPVARNPYMSRQVYNMDYSPSYTNRIAIANSRLPCTAGFYRNTLDACVDINECIVSKPCGSHQRCINTNGSYRCENLLQCAAGYKSTPEGASCIDIDECETGEHHCGENQICRNRNGGYICTCPTGHQLTRLSNNHNRCVDINECDVDRSAPPVCPSNALCFNTIGSYYCECKAGFQKKSEIPSGDIRQPSHAQCYDVDECQVIPGLCEQKCVNFWGGYRCSCNPGYELSYDNRTCNDIDECEIHKDYKLCMGFCNNVPGSYECSCPRGYTLATDKNSCRDINECETSNVCTGRHDICTNIRGSYKCTTISCPYGYINDPEQKNRCRQNSNFCEGDDCYTKPSAYTYNFITFVSKLMIPPDGRTIFTLRGPTWYDDIDFELKIIRIQAAPNIERASKLHFDTIKSSNQVNLLLKRSLEGPQDVELELSMTVFTNGMPRGKSVAKVFLYVSQYNF